MSWLFLKQVYSIAIRVTLHGRTTSYQIVFLTETNYRNKTMFLRFAFNNRFLSFDVKRFPRPLYRCVLLRLAENKREKSLNQAENLAIATTFKSGVLSFKKADWFKWGVSSKAINRRDLQCIRSATSVQRISMLIKKSKLSCRN